MSAKTTLRIGTFNIMSSATSNMANATCKSSGYDPELNDDEFIRYTVIVNMLYNSGLDVIFLQEAHFNFLNILGLGTGTLIDDRTRYGPVGSYLLDRYYIVQHVYYLDNTLMNPGVKAPELVILLKKESFVIPQLNERTYSLYLNGRVMSLIAKTQNSLGGQLIRLINVHLPSNTQSRHQIKNYLDSASSQPRHNVIVAGDFNMDINDEGVGIFHNVMGFDHLTRKTNVDGYSSYSAHTCSRDGTGNLTGAIVEKREPYKFLDRFYLKNMHSKGGLIKPYSTVRADDYLSSIRQYFADLSDDNRKLVTPDIKILSIDESRIIRVDNDLPFDRFGPPYCTEKCVKRYNRHLRDDTESEMMWPSDHALLIMEVGFGSIPSDGPADIIRAYYERQGEIIGLNQSERFSQLTKAQMKLDTKMEGVMLQGLNLYTTLYQNPDNTLALPYKDSIKAIHTIISTHIQELSKQMAMIQNQKRKLEQDLQSRNINNPYDETQKTLFGTSGMFGTSGIYDQIVSQIQSQHELFYGLLQQLEYYYSQPEQFIQTFEAAKEKEILNINTEKQQKRDDIHKWYEDAINSINVVFDEKVHSLFASVDDERERLDAERLEAERLEAERLETAQRTSRPAARQFRQNTRGKFGSPKSRDSGNWRESRVDGKNGRPTRDPRSSGRGRGRRRGRGRGRL